MSQLTSEETAFITALVRGEKYDPAPVAINQGINVSADFLRELRDEFVKVVKSNYGTRMISWPTQARRLSMELEGLIGD